MSDTKQGKKETEELIDKVADSYAASFEGVAAVMGVDAASTDPDGPKTREEVDYSDDRWKVGSGGLYWQPDDIEVPAKLVEKDGSETIIATSIDIGVMGKGNNLSLSVEQGIANYVKELAGEDNHLPNTKVGVMMHYLSEGLARDFGITWTTAPASLGGGTGRGGSTKEGRALGQRVMSKKDKNKLLAKLDMSYYQEDIAAGRLTLEEAFAQISVAFQQKKDIEDLGFYLSPNKTEGVLHYNWKNIVDKCYEDVPSITGCGLYVYNKLEVLLPNVFENYFDNNREHANKKNCAELVKSTLKGFVIEDACKYRIGNFKPNSGSITIKEDGEEKTVETGGFKNYELNSEDEILKHVGHKVKGEVKGIHLVKMKQSGMMKPRWICVDECVDGKQILSLYDKDSKMTFQS